MAEWFALWLLERETAVPSLCGEMGFSYKEIDVHIKRCGTCPSSQGGNTQYCELYGSKFQAKYYP